MARHHFGVRAVGGESTVAVHPEQQDRAGTRASAQGPAVVEAALRAAVSERLGATRFGLWFGESVRLGLSGKGDALEVRVPDPFFREWIQSHYTTSLLEAAEAVLGRPMQLSIRIHDEAEPPLGDVVEPAPARPEPDLNPSTGAASRSRYQATPRHPSFHSHTEHRTYPGHSRFLPRIGPNLQNACRRRLWPVSHPCPDRQAVRRDGLRTS